MSTQAELPPSAAVTDIHDPYIYKGIRLPMWTLYDHPGDMPDHYVLRLWDGMTCTATRFVFLADTLEGIQQQLDAVPGRFVMLERSRNDDGKIIAVFL